MKRITFIINPISGTQSKANLPYLIDNLLYTQKEITYEVLFSQYAGHGGEIATAKANDGVDLVVAVGGDGTVNEIAQALVHTQTALGILPFGSGKGLAHHLGVPMKVEDAIMLTVNGDTQWIDYGIINKKQLFFCSCGVGFDAMVSSKFAKAEKRGLFTYCNIALKENLHYSAEKYHITTETGKEIEQKAFVIACNNAAQYGNDAFIAPHASMQDGMFDVTLIDPINLLDAPLLAYQLFTRRIDQNTKTKTIRCKKIRIVREKPGVMHYDGEPIEAGKELLIETVPLGLKVLTPKDSSI